MFFNDRINKTDRHCNTIEKCVVPSPTKHQEQYNLHQPSDDNHGGKDTMWKITFNNSHTIQP